MPSAKISFKGHSGHMLDARLEMPSAAPLATAIFAHCFTCSKDIPAAARISKKLAGLGIAVLRFDFTGLGHSEGEFANTHFSSNVQDLILAADHLEQTFHAPTLLIGHSLGGAAVLRAASEIKSAKAIVTLGAPADPAHVVHNFGASLDDIAQNGQAEVSLAGRPFTIKQSFIEDVSAQNLDHAIGHLKRALLVMHSPIDATVGIENAAKIFSTAKHPKSYVTLDQADHLITKAVDAEYAATVIAAWASRYLDLDAPKPQTDVPAGIVRSSEKDTDGFLQDVNAGPNHHVLADEPVAYGGTDLGMGPFDFLSAGLAACTAMTVRMYARRKKWPLDHISVDVLHDKIHAEACESCETQSGKVDQFTRRVKITGDLDDTQIARLLEIADKCPVHRTMESEIHVKTELG